VWVEGGEEEDDLFGCMCVCVHVYAYVPAWAVSVLSFVPPSLYVPLFLTYRRPIHARI
jgi:hypothetical protein